MKSAAKNSEKISVTIDSDVLAKARELAAARFGGNLSAVFNSAMQTEIEVGRGSLSKTAQFIAEVRGTLRVLRLKITEAENAVDCLVPEMRLGIETKYRFSPGKGETATVAAMAYTVGQNLCDEIWIVTTDGMSQDERVQWERVAREFHLAPVRVVPANALVAALKQRAKQLKKNSTLDFADDKP